MNKKLVTGDTVYVLSYRGENETYKIVKEKITGISAGEYIRCGGNFYYPSEYYLTKESAAKAAILLASEYLKDFQEQTTKLERRAKQAERAIKDFAAIVTPPDGDS